MNQQPKAYQQGWIEFFKLRFKVVPDVLIPRPETELLVEEVLNYIKTAPLSPLTALDLGTGSGAIAISIAKNLPEHLPTSQVGIRIIASDISKKALKVARQNAKLHQAKEKITFIQSDLLNYCHPEHISESDHVIPEKAGIQKTWIPDHQPEADHPLDEARNDNQISPDIIVANLPYIPTERIKILDASVKDFEPHIALDGGKDGFELYRKLFQQIKEKNWHPKLIIGEIDYTHRELAAAEAKKYFPDAKIEIKKDLAHLQRILTIKF